MREDAPPDKPHGRTEKKSSILGDPLRSTFGWASALLVAAPLMFPPSAASAQITTYPAATHGNVTVLPSADYAIPIPNLQILSGYDFTSRTPQDFVPFAQNLGFNVQVVGDLTGGTWSISVYTPGNAMPVMEVDSKPGANTGQPAGTLPLMCAWGRNKTATVDFGESGTPRALFPKSDCLGIYVSVSSKPGFKTQPFSAFNSPILQNTQDAITYLNSQLSSIPGAPQFFFASPPSRSCIQIGIVPAAKEVLPPNSIATENNIRINFDQSLAPTIGLINLRNDEALNPNDYGAGPLLEHELLHALGLGHSGDAMGAPFMYSSTDIMSLTGTSNAGLTSAFIPLTADEKQALKEIYGTTPITLSASQREKFCKVIDPNATAAAAGGGTTGGTGIDPTPPSCSLSCQLPLVLDPDFMQLRVLADVEFVLP